MNSTISRRVQYYWPHLSTIRGKKKGIKRQGRRYRPDCFVLVHACMVSPDHGLHSKRSARGGRHSASPILLFYTGIWGYSRLSLFRLSEVRPPQYTGHLAWHGMLAICLLHKTHHEVRPLAIPFTGQCWLSQTRFLNVILYVYYGRIWRFGCGLANK